MCGDDGEEYSNECLARCQGVEVKCMGECPCTEPVHVDSSYHNIKYEKKVPMNENFIFTGSGKV